MRAAGLLLRLDPPGQPCADRPGSDVVFLAELDASGAVVASWPVSGDGREELIELTAIPGGFLADIAHTAVARVGDVALPAPHDPLSGAAVVVRTAR